VESGKVKWFSSEKGFGFINLDGNNDSIFVHFSHIQMDGYKTLQQNEPVDFQIEQTPKGFQAVNVIPKRFVAVAK
jgi:cold shock protein